MANTIWSVDKAHSEIHFKVKHLVISTVTGQFNDYDVKLESESEDLVNAKAEFTAKVDSITTFNTDRDNHLKSDDFFNVATYPEMKFQSERFIKTGENEYKMTGNLTIRNVTKEVTFQVVYGGSMVDPWGNHKAGYEITGKVNRFDYGLKWNVATEAGGLVAGSDVQLILNIQLIKS